MREPQPVCVGYELPEHVFILSAAPLVGEAVEIVDHVSPDHVGEDSFVFLFPEVEESLTVPSHLVGVEIRPQLDFDHRRHVSFWVGNRSIDPSVAVGAADGIQVYVATFARVETYQDAGVARELDLRIGCPVQLTTTSRGVDLQIEVQRLTGCEADPSPQIVPLLGYQHVTQHETLIYGTQSPKRNDQRPGDVVLEAMVSVAEEEVEVSVRHDTSSWSLGGNASTPVGRAPAVVDTDIGGE